MDIRRRPDDAFDYGSDHRHEPEWNPMMKRIEKLTDGPVDAGTRYVAEFATGLPMIMECTRFSRVLRVVAGQERSWRRRNRRMLARRRAAARSHPSWRAVMSCSWMYLAAPCRRLPASSPGRGRPGW